jgi:Zn-dependent protease with chaperone function
MNDLFRVALDASLRIGFVAICVGALMAVARVRSGAVRHAGWTAVLCAMLLMPILMSFTPVIGIPVETHVMDWSVDTPAHPGPVGAASQGIESRPIEASQPAPRAVPHASLWPVAALAVYFAGVLLLLSRMAAGWYSTRLLAAAAESVDTGVWQSATVAAPLTVGIVSPGILLPGTWKEWSEGTLRAVLAHERAHVRRRDTFVALAANLNCCVFWFHPLAWWLKRELAATAEQACDEVAVRTVSESGKYAEVLLQMAEAVRRRGGRLTWNGIGMHGAGSLQQRIDRILNGEASRGTSQMQKILIAVGCAAAIIVGAGCRQAVGVKASSVANNLDSEEKRRLGSFYSQVLMAEPESAYQLMHVRSPDYSSYVPGIRQKLEHSRDTTLLLDTSTTMVAWGRTRRKADFDPLAYGKSLVQRALQLDPQSVWAHQLLNVAADQQALDHLPESVWEGPLESRHQAIERLPDGERFRELAVLSLAAGDVAFRADHYGAHDEIGAKAGWQQAGRYAREALDMALRAQSDPDYGTAFFNANMTLGMEAMQDGDAKAAGSWLLRAAQAPVTDALRYPIPNARPWTDNWHFPSILMAGLLRAGQRDSVVEFLESYSNITVSGRRRCLEDVAVIRQGKLPVWVNSPVNR